MIQNLWHSNSIWTLKVFKHYDDLSKNFTVLHRYKKENLVPNTNNLQYKRDRQLWKKWLQIHQLERPGLWKESPLHQVWQHLGHPALHPIPHHQVHHQVETLCPKNWTETLFLKVLFRMSKSIWQDTKELTLVRKIHLDPL